ncbi:MAG: hypothetical protein OXS35_09425 [Dehalococcoidia bacterium]|nr:hypothetical protein [Dehalococcoidia bacterium]
MQTRRKGITSRRVEDVHGLRLMAVLRDLVRIEGLRGAARRLRVNNKTITRALASGRLTGRMTRAVEATLWDEAAEDAGERQDDRLGGLAQQVEAQETRLDGIEGLVTRGFDAVAAQLERDTDAGAPGRTLPVGQRRPEARPADPGVEERTIRNLLVTADPGEDDRIAYGLAWPVVAEWRSLRAAHPHEGGTLSWLERQEAILELELVLLETFGMTLPPEIEPLRGFARRGQLTWRRTALGNTRRRRVRRELWRWVRRVLTLGMWWR